MCPSVREMSACKVETNGYYKKWLGTTGQTLQIMLKLKLMNVSCLFLFVG